MAAVETVLAGWRADTEAGPTLLSSVEYWLRAKLGVHGSELAAALADDFANPPAPPVEDPEPQTQPEILAAARALVGRLEHGSLRALENTVLDALDSSCAAPAAVL